MTETASERTNRQYLKLHLSEQWTYQQSVFYASPEDSVSLLTEQVRFKEALRKHVPDQPMLIRIQLLDDDSPQDSPQAYLTIFTTSKVHGLRELACKTFKKPMRAIGRGLPPGQRDGIANKIKNGEPHDLAEFFGVSKVRRWSVLNKPLIDPTLQYKAS